LSIKTAKIVVCIISSWNITMKVTALMLLLALAVHGQDHDANNRQPKAPFFFNPLTLTIYSTIRTQSTSYIACLTEQAAGLPACRRRRSLEEEIIPSIVER
jgi:ABC-type arginine transport system permease subunit